MADTRKQFGKQGEEIAVSVLRKKGYKVIEADSGQAALDLLRRSEKEEKAPPIEVHLKGKEDEHVPQKRALSALDAAQAMAGNGIEARVLNVSTVRPLDDGEREGRSSPRVVPKTMIALLTTRTMPTTSRVAAIHRRRLSYESNSTSCPVACSSRKCRILR